MKSTITMWKYTRMIVLTAICAALYATGIVVLRLPPPISLVPLSQLFPVPLSLMFGPAGAWGIAFGATIGSLVTGEFSINQLFGFIGNFLLGALPFLLWTRLRPLADGDRSVKFSGVRYWLLYAVAVIGTAFATAVVISWPMHILGIVPFSFLVNLIGVQDALIGFLTIMFLSLVYKRVESLGLVYWEVMDEKDLDVPRGIAGVVGAWLITIASVVAWILGGFVMPNSAALIGGVATGLILFGLVLCSLKRNPAVVT
jgi:energy-coupling factor transport system substrate-specific component